MTGNPEVIKAFSSVYRYVKATEEQAHLQEHVLEAEGWKTLSRSFDDIETNIHTEIVHKLMKRVNKLGARVMPGYAFEPMCWSFGDIEAAYQSMVDHLVEIRGKSTSGDSEATGLVALCNAAEAADDYASEKLTWKFIKWIECKIGKFENMLAHLRKVGVNAYLAEMMDD